MQKIILEIDDIVDEVSDYMSKMYDEFHRSNPSVTDDYPKGAAMIVFRLGLEYFTSARKLLSEGHVVGGGSLIRTVLENIADLFYIYDKPKYPKAYVDSMKAYDHLMKAVVNKKSHELAESRELKQANKWTNASIEDRIKASGSSLLNMYDMLSYQSHPNPGSLVYLTNTRLRQDQLNVLKQANCMSALTLMSVVLNHSDIATITIKELNAVSQKLGHPTAL